MIASRLFEAQCERAVSLGHKEAGLIVDVDKPQAEALYARLGLIYLDDKDFFGHKMKHPDEVHLHPNTLSSTFLSSTESVATPLLQLAYQPHSLS